MLPIHLFCQLPFSFQVPHVLILRKFQRGSSIISFHGYSNLFFLLFHIFLSNMLEINVYSIIDSKVFSVTFGVNFLLPIVDKGFMFANTF